MSTFTRAELCIYEERKYSQSVSQRSPYLGYLEHFITGEGMRPLVSWAISITKEVRRKELGENFSHCFESL